MMANIPFSEVTIIAALLGFFFLLVAFYKSIFHKRVPPSEAALQPSAAPRITEEQPVKLSDPFQQVPVDALPQPSQSHAGDNAAFYPKIQQASSAQVSAFRQYNPNAFFDESALASKNTMTYEWE
jgi:hypothetical protein